MGVGISGSSFSKVFASVKSKPVLEEVLPKAQTVKAHDGTDTFLLHTSLMRSLSIPAQLALSTLLQSHEPTPITLLGHFAREMSQQPSRRRKSAGKGGQQA